MSSQTPEPAELQVTYGMTHLRAGTPKTTAPTGECGQMGFELSVTDVLADVTCPQCRRAATTAIRVLVTGSRTWTDENAIRQQLASIVTQCGPENIVVVHGACPSGADAIADAVATAWGGGMRVERHPADWSAHGMAAGYRRNAEMVALGADFCLAFIKDGSRGASHTAKLADKAGIETRRVIA